MFFFGRTPTKHENNVFRLFKLFNTSSTSFCFFFDQNRHGQRPIVVSTWFPARWPFSVAYWSCCFRVRWGLLGRFGRGTWRVKMPFFLSAGFSAQVLFWKACGLRDPPQYKDKDSGAKVECCLARPWFIENPPSERDCKKKHLKFSVVKNYSIQLFIFGLSGQHVRNMFAGQNDQSPKFGVDAHLNLV